MSRAKVSDEDSKKINLQQPANTWVLLCKGDTLSNSKECVNKNPEIVSLRHPQSGEPAFFLFTPDNDAICEILIFDEEKRSWFIDDYVKSDGKLYISTPFDPIFLVIPYVQKHCCNQAIPLNDLLRDTDFPETERLLRCNGLKYLTNIADRKGCEDLNAYKYNEEKLLSWLQEKTERVAKVLNKNDICGSGIGAVSATFVRASRNEVSDDEVYLKYAHGIVSEYISEDLSKKLSQHLHLPEDEESQSSAKRKSSASSGPEQKKAKLEKQHSSVVVSEPSKMEIKPAKTTTKEKARAKAATGNKTISSFFQKK